MLERCAEHDEIGCAKRTFQDAIHRIVVNALTWRSKPTGEATYAGFEIHPPQVEHLSIRTHLRMAERHKDVLEKEIQTLIQNDTEFKRKFAILTSIPFIGKITVTILISQLMGLGQVNCKQIAALAGVAPMSWDSGAKHGKRMIRGGRKCVRNALHMCAVGTARRAGTFGGYYQRLIKQGKHPKVALTAITRKLIILANTLIAEDRCWQPTRP